MYIVVRPHCLLFVTFELVMLLMPPIFFTIVDIDLLGFFCKVQARGTQRQGSRWLPQPAQHSLSRGCVKLAKGNAAEVLAG
jgi:hypothetical protein